MVYADINNTKIDNSNIYSDDSFYKYIAREPIFSLAYYDLVLEKIQKYFKKEDIKILEFGCGPGFFLRRAKTKNIDACGCDFSDYSRLAKEKFHLNIKINNIFDAGYKNNEFDVVITHATHEHLGNMTEISRKLFELLKPGGLYIISGVPNYNTIPIKFFRDFTNNTPPSHVNFFEKKSIQKLYDSMNLKTISVKTYGMSTWLWILILKIKKIFRKKRILQKNQHSKNNTQISEPKISKIHRLIAKIYVVFHIPCMGRNIEIWGKK